MQLKTIIAAGGLVLNEKDELLMIYRRGKWDLPKGKLDEGERIEDCAIREVMEETGLKEITRGALLTISYHTYFDQWIGEEVIKETHWFSMTAPSDQSLIPQTEEDIELIRWVSGVALEECLADSYENIVSVVRQGVRSER